MKIKMSFTFLTFLLVSVLAFYVFAQSQTEQDPGKTQGTVRVGSVSGSGIGIASTTADVVLCKTDGEIIDKSFPSTGTLRIEYKNGSVSQIDLWDVKKMTVTALPGRQLGD
jgi:hypothetical protein